MSLYAEVKDEGKKGWKYYVVTYVIVRGRWLPRSRPGRTCPPSQIASPCHARSSRLNSMGISVEFGNIRDIFSCITTTSTKFWNDLSKEHHNQFPRSRQST